MNRNYCLEIIILLLLCNFIGSFWQPSFHSNHIFFVVSFCKSTIEQYQQKIWQFHQKKLLDNYFKKMVLIIPNISRISLEVRTAYQLRVENETVIVYGTNFVIRFNLMFHKQNRKCWRTRCIFTVSALFYTKWAGICYAASFLLSCNRDSAPNVVFLLTWKVKVLH